MIAQSNVLVAPVVTEKSMAIEGKYTFKVHTEASKPAIKAAVKEFYGVEAVNVHIIPIKSKTRTIGRGREMTKRSNGKKAVVTLKAGQKLNFNDVK